MKLVTYQINEHPRLGVLQANQVIDLKLAAQAANGGGRAVPDNMMTLLSAGPAGLNSIAEIIAAIEPGTTEVAHPLEQVTLLPPVLQPGKVIALGRNYAAHAKEGGSEPPEYPMLFHKTAGALLGHGGKIVIPPITTKVDYEGELAVIIGKRCKQVSPDKALDYVAGYTIANDVSARDLQRRTTQFTAGKMLDTFGPLGPALVTRDEVPDPGNLSLKTRLNGQLMQDGHTSDMIFSVPFTISYISQIATLHVGDVILTGTPEGVGFARTPPVFLKEGDVVEVEIEKLGKLINPVINQR